MDKSRLLALVGLIVYAVGFLWCYMDFGWRFLSYYSSTFYAVAAMFIGLLLCILAVFFSLVKEHAE